METTLRGESLLTKIAKRHQQSCLLEERLHRLGNIVNYLREQHNVPPEDIVSLQCATMAGSFGGFAVSMVRIFNGVEAARHGVIVRNYHDLDNYPELVAFEGYAFNNGPVHLHKQKSPATSSVR